jgi:DnaJ-class molecular chaperone
MNKDEPRDGYHWETCPKCKGSRKQPDIIYHGPDQPCDRCKATGRIEVCHDGSDFVGGA